MKKIIVLMVGVCLFALPATAATNFYIEENSGRIIMGTTDCSGDEHLVTVVDPTDPSSTTNDDDDPAPTTGDDDPEEETEGKTGLNYVDASQTLINTLLGKYDPKVENKSLITQNTTDIDHNDIDTIDFEDLQEQFLAYVRDVNWKTGLKITYRDLTWFNRMKMACKGINQLTKPVQASFSAYVGDISSQLEEASDKLVDKIATSARGHSFDSMAKLSVVGIVNAIDTKNPFLIMLVDHETYNHMVALEPKIATLYQDMYTFFKIRAVRMAGQDYDKNTQELIRVSKLGEGNYFTTWHALAEYATKMMQLDRRGLLNPDDEKNIHIVRLEASMHYIKEQTRVEKRAAEIAMKDPKNAGMVYELQHGEKKKPSLDEKALKLLESLSQDEIKALIFKYRIK